MSEQRDFDVVTFGETMLRLAPPGFGRLEEAVSLDVRIGGSESNTAVALSRLGLRAAWWSKLPANPLGRRIENEIRRWGVDTSHVLWDSEADARAGLYFLDFGVPPRGIDVYYDRRASSVSRVRAEEIDTSLVKRARLLHLSGITPALSPECVAGVHALMQAAKEAGTRISFDTNYRAKLWSPQEAKTTLEALMPLVDVLLCPLSDVELLFGISGDGEMAARAMRARYGIPSVVVTCGGDGARAADDRGDWSSASAMLPHIVDRVGAGDAFNAGVLMGYLNGDIGTGMEYGSAMAALKHTIPGDLLISTREEIETARAGTAHSIRR